MLPARPEKAAPMEASVMMKVFCFRPNIVCGISKDVAVGFGELSTDDSTSFISSFMLPTTRESNQAGLELKVM